MKPTKTNHYSRKCGSISKGCGLCVKGRKLVLFVTGICPKRCWYCPLAETKKNKDIVWANEWPVRSEKDIVEEARLCSSEGAGITGGDPLARIGRTLRYIRLLKRTFGKGFHIHLYTPTALVTEENLQRLFSSGLDEIRFHPDMKNRSGWEKVKLASGFEWSTGIEIPVIPGMEKETQSLIDYFKGHVDFFNLNELEISDTNMDEAYRRGFRPKSIESCAVKGSEEMALRLMERYCKEGIRMHYCTAKLKDRAQLSSRIKRRAKNTALESDRICSDGMLERGAIYLPDLAPTFGYRRRLEKMSRAERGRAVAKLESIRKELGIRNSAVEAKKPRIIAKASEIRKIRDKLKQKNLLPAVVKEYPTWDQTEVEVDFL